MHKLRKQSRYHTPTDLTSRKEDVLSQARVQIAIEGCLASKFIHYVYTDILYPDAFTVTGRFSGLIQI